MKYDYKCKRCGASFSLPLGMTCDDHNPIPIPYDDEPTESSCATTEAHDDVA